ncbi:hypothetical protein [Streptomyces sp. NBC_00829]|uniref:hypothetical protein n=1 Tax=Streptomyces sp. NBC_00829 TaxID=2903679 RepID=UPI00386F188E|nr:hypothetical protein OG293_13400 [Streptomyces sp. NBC_00829]
MRKLGTAIAVLGLTALGLAVPATSAQAAALGPTCNAKWPGRDGNVRAWQHNDCTGDLLGVTQGSDPNWGDGAGPFQGNDFNDASSVMNSGYTGGKDVVAFYLTADYAYQYGYVCLSPNELYADNLTDNYFTSNGGVVNDRIGSHTWVTASACAAGSWLT